MFETLLCGYNIFCHFDNLQNGKRVNKYPADVVVLCNYFDEQKVKLPDYCFYKSEIKSPRKRNEF